MRYFLRAITYQTAGSRHTNLALPAPKFWQVLGVTLLICLGLVSEGLACHDAASATTATPTSLTYYAVQGATNPPNQTITVSRKSTWQATITASDNASWLSVSPTTTYITTSAKFAAAVKTTGLVAGTYRGTVTIKVGTWCTRTVSATLILSPPTTTTTTTTKSATLAWNAVTSTSITGYKVYVGEAPRLYTRTITVGAVTSATVSSLTVGRTYYFCVTAYNGGGESPPSTEVNKTIQ
ncbi:MAG TPA: fibronectin type III domain-containing protein [Nitrospira sp.]|nr:fibronectin type III domain-containing protein [Nitrospira sp.]